MKKFILILLFNITLLNAWTWKEAAIIVKHLHDKNFKIENYSNTKKEDIKQNHYSIKNNSLFVKKYINNKNCDQILRNKGYFTTCYNYNLKSATVIYIKLDGNLVNSKNIKKRPRFYPDLNIPKRYRTYTQDYTHTGYDRGHSGANDASNDYSLKSQKATYVMSNIVPQYPKTNRKSYLKVEKYERKIASNLGFMNSLTINIFTDYPKRIGRSELAVPKGFYKIYWNKKSNFKKCFYIPNDNMLYNLKEMVINCKKIS